MRRPYLSTSRMSSWLKLATDSDTDYILVKDTKVVAARSNNAIVTDVSRGELLIRKGGWLHVRGNKEIVFKYGTSNIAPLDDVQLGMLEAIQTPNGRFSVFVTDGWLDWGAAVNVGDSVYIRIKMKDGSECCSTARVHYIGRLTMTEDHAQPGTPMFGAAWFGVEITDSRYYGCGATDGMFRRDRYFTCPVNNGLFLSLASVAKEPEWLKLQYHQRRDIPQLTEEDIPATAAKRSNKEQSDVSASPNVGETSVGTNQLNVPIGTRVILTSKGGRKVKGTVWWVGHLALEFADPKVKIPVYCVETDVYIGFKDYFEPVISMMGRPTINVSSGHGKVFISQTMVELDHDEQVNDSDISTAATKDVLRVAGIDYEESREAALIFEKEKAAALAHILRPEIAGQTDIHMQIKPPEDYKTTKQYENVSASRDVQQNYPQSSSYLGRQSSSTQDPYQLSHSQPSSVPLQGDWSSPLMVGSAVILPNSNPPMCGTIRWIGSIPKVQGYVAGVELDVPMEGCTDGTCYQNGLRYFTCQPNSGYYCLLEHLMPDPRFMPNEESHIAVHDQDEADLTIRLNEIQEQLAQEKRISQKYKEEYDRAMKKYDQVIKDRDQAIKAHYATKKDFDALKEEHSQCKAFWIVPRHHVTVLEKSLGGGAWGYVKEGKLRGQQVAVKCVHETIITQHTIKRVYREICTMSQVHHPNLVLFIAAVLDDQGGPMIITELLDTTLRKAYEDSLLNMAQCMDIFRDVACALCYLHELEAPIIHRDVSSSNVLLKAMAKDQWKAKLSDFGSANWAKEASTMGEGAIVYTAPEAYPIAPSLNVQPPPQTTKIDVYSYGILLCEVTLREFPNPKTLHEWKAKLKAKDAMLHSLMLKCIQHDPAHRPTMAAILQELKKMLDVHVTFTNTRTNTTTDCLTLSMEHIPEEVCSDQLVNSDLFYRYVGEQKGIQGHQNSCYLDATLFGLFALSDTFDTLFLKAGPMDKRSIEYIIWKNIVNPLRSCGAARYESVMKLREQLDDLGKMKGITKDEKDPEEFLNMLFKHAYCTETFIQIRRPYGVQGEFFVQLFLESEANSDVVPNISGMLQRMFTEQDLSFTKVPPKLLIRVPRFGKQFKTYKRIIPDKTLNVSKLVHTDEDGFCFWCKSPARLKCDDCGTDFKMCSACSDTQHKNTKFKSHKPVALPKRADMELDLLSVICIETSHYVCFTRSGDKWLFFDSMANRVDDKYCIPRCTDCSDDINEWVYKSPERLLSAEPRQIPELVRRFTQDIYMCVYVIPYDPDMYASL